MIRRWFRNFIRKCKGPSKAYWYMCGNGVRQMVWTLILTNAKSWSWIDPKKPGYLYYRSKCNWDLKSYKHLGIGLSSKGLTSLITNHISYIIANAEKRVSCIKNLGLCSNGLSPETSIEMHRTLIRTLSEYTAQVLTFEHYYMKRLSVPKTSKSREKITRLRNCFKIRY